MICAIGSPFVLKFATRWSGLNWDELADVGETYGAAAAIFSALAAAAVAVSLLYQAQQLRLSRLQHVRQVERELSLRLMDDPELAEIAGYNAAKITGVSARQHAFAVIYLHYLSLAYEGGVASKEALQAEALRYMFGSDATRRIWAAVRHTWFAHKTDPTHVSFSAIVDESYQQAIRESPPPRDPGLQTADRPQGPSAGAAYAVLAAGATGWFFGRRQRR